MLAPPPPPPLAVHSMCSMLSELTSISEELLLGAPHDSLREPLAVHSLPHPTAPSLYSVAGGRTGEWPQISPSTRGSPPLLLMPSSFSCCWIWRGGRREDSSRFWSCLKTGNLDKSYTDQLVNSYASWHMCHSQQELCRYADEPCYLSPVSHQEVADTSHFGCIIYAQWAVFTVYAPHSQRECGHPPIAMILDPPMEDAKLKTAVLYAEVLSPEPLNLEKIIPNTVSHDDNV